MAVEDDKLDDSSSDKDKTVSDKSKTDEDLVTKLVNEKLDENLKPIKEKLDAAFSQRDAALKKVKEYEDKERAAELKRLEEEGKHKEVFDLKLAEERAEKEVLRKKNVELTRDVEVRQALSALDFRNDKASDIAFGEVAKELVQTENGVWVHRSGISVKDFVKTFVDNEDNAFLFRIRASSGSGGKGPTKTDASSDGNKSIFGLSQEEVLKRAAEGTLRRR